MLRNNIPDGAKSYPRAVLTATQAIEIYSYRKTRSNGPKTDPLLTGRSAAVAKKFNVSPKAIRDIWNRRTWTQETQHVWTNDERPMIRPERLHRGSLSTSSCVPAATPYSPECVIDYCDAWWRPPSAHGRSIYTDDSMQQNHFHFLSPWPQLLVSSSTASADLPCITNQSSAAHPPSHHPFISPPAGPPDAGGCALPPAEMAAGEEEACIGSPWAAARGELFGAEGAPDPFTLDWPAW